MRVLTSICALAIAAFAVGQEEDAETITFSLPPKDGHEFVETFEESFSWVLSSDPKYTNQPVESSSESNAMAPFKEDKSILFKSANKHYGVGRAFDTPVDPTDKPLIVQYEVKLTEGLTCGGAYLKLLKSEDGLDLNFMNNDSPYVIMFGPDSCGSTNKVHFIFRHQNPVSGEWEEKHATKVPAPIKDKESHLYTLIIRPDNSYEILIDLESKSKGSLLEDFEPPVNPSKEIDDPEDHKPADWVDEAEIRDPDAVKPDDWDEDAPKKIPDESATIPKDWLENEDEFIADPTASEPSDWDEEEDGEWEAPVIKNPKCEKVSGCGEWKRPLIDNPDYKGKWSAPLIANPEYKGEWKARQIANPNFFEDFHPHNMPKIGAVAVEIWTTNGGIRMDNFLVGHNEAKAKEFGSLTWQAKKSLLDKYSKEKQQERRKQKRQLLLEEGGFMNLLEAYSGEAVDLAMENQLAAAVTAIVLMVTLVLLCTGRSKPKPRHAPPAARAPAAQVDNEDEDGDDETLEEKEGDAGDDKDGDDKGDE